MQDQRVIKEENKEVSLSQPIRTVPEKEGEISSFYQAFYISFLRSLPDLVPLPHCFRLQGSQILSRHALAGWLAD